MKKILTFLAAMSMSASVMASEPPARNLDAAKIEHLAADMTGLPRKVFAAKTVKVKWIATCEFAKERLARRYELKGQPTPWHKHGIQFTTIGGQKVIVMIGSNCIFEKVQ